MGKAPVSGETFKSVVPCCRRGNKLHCQTQTMETQLGLLEQRVLQMSPTLSHYPPFVSFHCQLCCVIGSAISSHLDVNMRGSRCKRRTGLR